MHFEPMPITPSVLRWARERAGFSLTALADDFRNIEDWEEGAASPSYPQLERLSEKFKVPVAVFFFPDPPEIPSIEETFRTLGPEQVDDIPPRIRLLLRKARTFQISLVELNDGRNPADRQIVHDLKITRNDDVAQIAETVRDYLGISMEDQIHWEDAETALNAWRDVFLRAGVYIFKDQFRQPEYSGFCLYDDEFPIIYVNNTTAKTRQIFTLFHELAHLLFHTSGIDTVSDRFIDQLAGDNKKVEIICNQVAASTLVPEKAFEEAFGEKGANEATAAELAELFSVSREFIFRRFLDRGLITTGEYEDAARRWSAQRTRGAGGDHYNTKIAYLGKQYINLAFQRFYQNKIDFNQLAEVLDTKPKNLTRLEDYVSRRRMP